MSAAYADTGFIASLYLEETTSAVVEQVFAAHGEQLLISPLVVLELRNAMNFALGRGRITSGQRDAAWRQFEANLSAGTYVVRQIETVEWYEVARGLSDRHTARESTRTLDLLHVAAALRLGAREFFTLDRRQGAVARAEGMTVRPG